MSDVNAQNVPTVVPQTQDQHSIAKYCEDIQTKLKFCQMVAESGMVPSRYKTPQQILTAVLMGQELGFAPLAALRMINVINGTPCLSAAGMKAKALQAGIQLKTVKWDDTVCRIEGRRPGWNHWEAAEFSIDDAKRADLLRNPTWSKHPRAMLHARAVTMLLRTIATDIIEGMSSTEELEDMHPEGGEERPLPPRNVTPGSIAGESWGKIQTTPQKTDPEVVFVNEETGEIDDLPEDFTA